MQVKAYMQSVGVAARESSRVLARAGSAIKNNALLAIAEAVNNSRADLLSANELDMENGRSKGLDDALLDRLALNDERISSMIEVYTRLLHCRIPWARLPTWAIGPAAFS